jgi:hypothetical protein
MGNHDCKERCAAHGELCTMGVEHFDVAHNHLIGDQLCVWQARATVDKSHSDLLVEIKHTIVGALSELRDEMRDLLVALLVVQSTPLNPHPENGFCSDADVERLHRIEVGLNLLREVRRKRGENARAAAGREGNT